ncbi:MAG: Na+/H+ antiporter NhaC family protein [Rhodothermales bacterium]
MSIRVLSLLAVLLAGSAVLAQVDPAADMPAQEVAPDAPVLLDEAPAEAAPAAPVEAPKPAPTWLSLVPALVAIAAALLFRQVIVALFGGVWIGAWIHYGTLGGAWYGLLDTVQVYVLDALADADHAAILIFTLLIGGVVGIIQKNGGTSGIVGIVTDWAKSARRGQLATALLGTAVFFDDYANTLIVGGTMRPITDKLRISREKLAYIVDSTAAPVASLALVTTWIGYEVGLIGTAIDKLPTYDESAYAVFLQSIPYSFYPILALGFVYAIATSRRDFGPMLRAERRARETGQLYRPGSEIEQAEAESSVLVPSPDTPRRAFNAIIPIVVLVVGVLGGLYVTGEGESIREIISSADSYKAMMWASLLAAVVAVLMSVGQRILTLDESINAMYAGMKGMLLAIIILVLAWALSGVNDVLGTADYLIAVLSGNVSPGFVPTIVFVLAALTAFSTGSSWGTMGILMPLVVPLAYGVLAADGLHTNDEYHHIIYSAVSAVLAGAVWGDHCSPISDTTILSSLASSCDHIDHVRTQLPYALLVGIVAIGLGTLPAGFGAPWWICLPLGAAVLLAVLRFVGQPVEGEPEAA